jgi:hypothetical protein
VLPFLMTGSRELLEDLPRHETAHAALLTDIGCRADAGDQRWRIEPAVQAFAGRGSPGGPRNPTGVGRAMLTTVASSAAIPEPSTVIASTHRPGAEE